MNFSRDHIIINNRIIALPEMISGSAVSFTPFETETFSFIKKWLTGEIHFPLTTSGSTGTPKEIILTRNQLQQSAHRTIDALALTNQHTTLVCLDTKYIAGKMMLARALEANMNIVAAEPASNPFKNLPADTSIDFTALVPLQLEEILNDTPSAEKLNRVKNIIIGGAAVSENLKSKIRNLQPNVFATYGMTETVSHIALQKLNGMGASDHFTAFDTIGISIDERNCLVITIPEFTEPVVTNDLVELTGSHTFRWLARYDNIINSGGVKLSPELIEQKIGAMFSALHYTQAFFVAGVPDERLGQKLVLVIEGNTDTDTRLLSALKEKLSPYEIPKAIITVAQFERTATQKINRAKTLERALQPGI